jgi:glycosyltransferase involved in cell wall biosynthesis
LSDAIASVFSQTFEQWELLLVDDGSSDHSTGVALETAANFPEKVRYLEHPEHRNRGMSASRNTGIKASRGEFIAFLDADDVWLPNKLIEQVKILVAHPEAAMVYGPIEWWYSWTARPEDKDRDFIPPMATEVDTLIAPPRLLTSLLQNEGVTATNGVLRRQIVEDVGGYEDSFKGMYEDQVLFAKICLKAPIFVAGGCWYRWRKHPDSACAVALRAGVYQSSRLNYLRWLTRYLKEKHLFYGSIRDVVRNEWIKCRHPAFLVLMQALRYREAILNERLRSVARRALPRQTYQWLRGRYGRRKRS